ncbi:MAG: carboxypeptidase-like regulatory domain-containing protein [Vicinamibacterales bacterium]
MTGTVKDPSDAVIAGATVTLTSPSTGVEARAATTADGA